MERRKEKKKRRNSVVPECSLFTVRQATAFAAAEVLRMELALTGITQRLYLELDRSRLVMMSEQDGKV